jgi:hypothetical protein
MSSLASHRTRSQVLTRLLEPYQVNLRWIRVLSYPGDPFARVNAPQYYVVPSPEGTTYRSPPRKRWENIHTKQGKPQQGRHILLAALNHFPLSALRPL